MAEKRKDPPEQESLLPLTKRPRITPGDVRVAKYYPGKPPPTMPGYKTILIHVRGDELGGDLSPYVLRDERGCLLENVWQFAKVYARVGAQRTPMSRFQPNKIIWEHPAEEHYTGDDVTPAYWAWREKGRNNSYAVRYPNGFNGRSQCLFSLWPDMDPQRLDYIAARKKIYCGEYARLAPHTPHFKKLSAMLASGESLLLAEVDGPDPTLTFPPYDQISAAAPGLLACEETIRLLVNDVRKPFGHGYVIAALLLGGEQWMRD